jgi:hypothetical protein
LLKQKPLSYNRFTLYEYSISGRYSASFGGSITKVLCYIFATLFYLSSTIARPPIVPSQMHSSYLTSKHPPLSQLSQYSFKNRNKGILSLVLLASYCISLASIFTLIYSKGCGLSFVFRARRSFILLLMLFFSSIIRVTSLVKNLPCCSLFSRTPRRKDSLCFV